MRNHHSQSCTYKSEYDVIIIGAGIIGAWIARELSKFKGRIAVLDKEPSPGFGVTKCGLSQIHAPDFCPSGSLKGRLCLDAPRRFKKMADELNATFREVDELWLALEPSQVGNLEAGKRRGEEFGANGFEIIGPDKIRELEPNLTKKAVAALYVRGLGVVYPPEWAFALIENGRQNGVRVFYNTVVSNIQKHPQEGFTVVTSNGKFKTRHLVNAAGLFVDEIAKMVGDNEIGLILTKGTMAILDKSVSHLTRHMVYGTFSGQHSQAIAPTAHGNLIVGLGSFTAAENKSDRKVPREKLKEVIKMGQELIPTLSQKDVITSFAGIRSENNKVENGDFYIAHSETAPGMIHAAIGSPGLTAAPAVADLIINMLADAGYILKEKNDFLNKRIVWNRFDAATLQEREIMMAKNPKYGHITCRCEKVTEAEILETIQRGADTMDGIKHLTRAGMGRCQGGFCGPVVLDLLAKEIGCLPEAVTKKGCGSNIIAGVTKEQDLMRKGQRS